MVDPRLIVIHATAWARSRGCAPPVAEGPALRIEVGLPDQQRRHVFLDPPVGMAELAATIDQPMILLKAGADEQVIRAILPRQWHVERTGTMMALATLPDTALPLPPGYTLVVSEAPGVVDARIETAVGDAAGRGKLVVIDRCAVHDRIHIEEHHRHIGLGRAMMTALGREARRRGARHGLLTATVAGRALYRQIGWIDRAPWITAQIKA